MKQPRNAFILKLTTSILTVMVLLSISIPAASAQPSLSGADLIFMDDFETGNLSTWDRVKDDSGDLIVHHEAVYQGEWGLKALIDDQTPIYALDRFPTPLNHYRARFYINLDSLIMFDEHSHPIFAGKDLDNQWDFVVVLGKNKKSNYAIRVQALTDDGGRNSSGFSEIGSAGWHSIEIEWVSGLPGRIKLWIDGSLMQSIEVNNNSARSLARVYLGAFGGIDATTSGSIYFDNFESRKTTYIGGDVLQDASK
jgi:hypothetical protein